MPFDLAPGTQTLSPGWIFVGSLRLLRSARFSGAFHTVCHATFGPSSLFAIPQMVEFQGGFFAFHFATVTYLPLGAAFVTGFAVGGGGFGAGGGFGTVGPGSGAGSVVTGGRPPPGGASLMVVTSWS
jgi:hypothetical protein